MLCRLLQKLLVCLIISSSVLLDVWLCYSSISRLSLQTFLDRSFASVTTVACLVSGGIVARLDLANYDDAAPAPRSPVRLCSSIGHESLIDEGLRYRICKHPSFLPTLLQFLGRKSVPHLRPSLDAKRRNFHSRLSESQLSFHWETRK